MQRKTKEPGLPSTGKEVLLAWTEMDHPTNYPLQGGPQLSPARPFHSLPPQPNLLTKGNSRLLWHIDDDFLEALHVADAVEKRDEKVQPLAKRVSKGEGISPEQSPLSPCN